MSLSRLIAKSVHDNNLSSETLFRFLEGRNLTFLMPSIKKALEDINLKIKRGEIIQIETPFNLDEKSLLTIKGQIDKDARHEVIINKSLLAGFRAKYKGKLSDGSALRIIKQVLDQK